ncbi:hypothetical protein JDV02_001877 [Purpureocillium takamizusanense]|uniref:NAD dependent epimerase/dehydratase n=1 Tax=Purpureocillium takamizusanense TaxID=2060973 RepID=A0A9Q8QAK8_9HYPO|nr:uncharacterized protein JDV02_001877 [Purpureocillium takamizusanense]UNI15337.1 hypothetical protein JDV02_001877 [Purpureocillium takamizusanense]
MSQREMKVLALGLPRTGSASLAEALRILGYKNVHHGLNNIDNKSDWRLFDRAADASFSVLPGYSEEVLKRQEWDQVFGSCEAATDTASFFAPQLVQTYPRAKVILTIRDFDPWFNSIDETIIRLLWNPMAEIVVRYAGPVLGVKSTTVARKLVLGFFEARNVCEIRSNALRVYERHHRTIQSMVPASQLLIYRMGDGWEPICSFLGKPVPEIEFPRINEMAELKRRGTAVFISRILSATGLVIAQTLGAMILGLIAWKAGRYWRMR